MPGSPERVRKAFAHETPDRTPLFEIFQRYHPIHWPICGRTIGTDEAMRWDALVDGIAWEELVEADVQAALAVYTSDGNHRAIKDDFFFNSHVDGYKEVDKAAGMSWDYLLREAILYMRMCVRRII